MSAQEQREERAARNQAWSRFVNERIADVGEVLADSDADLWSFACECFDLDCIARVELTLQEYRNVRKQPDRFSVTPHDDHVDPAVEQVAARHQRYWVVQKLRAAAVRARELAEDA